MKENIETKFIFYILLESKLPDTYYQFDEAFKKLGLTLIPIAIDQIQILGSICQQSQIFVMSSSTDFSEFKAYNSRVRGLLKFLLKTDRITFFNISSFHKLNDDKRYYQLKNYHFIHYPQSVQRVSIWIKHLFEFKSNAIEKWPGGKRAASSVLGL